MIRIEVPFEYRLLYKDCKTNKQTIKQKTFDTRLDFSTEVKISTVKTNFAPFWTHSFEKELITIE